MENIKDKVILTGIKPTGQIHIGNYIGAIKPTIELSHKTKTFVFIADLHALNSNQNATLIKQYTEELSASIISLGLNLENSIIYRQSDIPEVYCLSNLLMNITPKGLLNRAHAYKALTDINNLKNQDKDYGINMGLYTYPVLMATDILLYNADIVPVGQDQTQHIEITRDIAGYFNKIYGMTFKIPSQLNQKSEILLGTDGKKMSKSNNNTIPIFSEEKILRKKIMQIMTDSKTKQDPKNPDESIIFNIYKHFANIEEIEKFRKKFINGGLGYGEAKEILFDTINNYYKIKRQKYIELMSNKTQIENILKDGASKARTIAEKTFMRVKKLMLGN